MKSKSKDRTWVIEIGVRFENNISWIIANKLGINREESLSFGDGSQSLGFNQRVNLLLDMNMLTSTNKEQSKFQYFMYIRNKFAHVWKMDSLQKVFESNTQMTKFIENSYKTEIEEFNETYYRLNQGLNPDYSLKTNEPERYYKYCFEVFYDELFKIVERMNHHIIDKLETEREKK